MALIKEDGTIVAGANSFVTAAELVAYADLRGIEYPATEPEQEQLLIMAMDYINSIEPKFQGIRVSSAQELPFPRIGVYVNGFLTPADEIPTTLKNGQIEAALQANVGGLLINGTVQNIKREKVDVVEVEYYSGGKWSSVQLDRVDNYLKPLYKQNANGQMMARV